MALTREPGASVLIEVLDRILDKGMVIDAWIRVNLVGNRSTYRRSTRGDRFVGDLSQLRRHPGSNTPGFNSACKNFR